MTGPAEPFTAPPVEKALAELRRRFPRVMIWPGGGKWWAAFGDLGGDVRVEKAATAYKLGLLLAEERDRQAEQRQQRQQRQQREEASRPAWPDGVVTGAAGRWASTSREGGRPLPAAPPPTALEHLDWLADALAAAGLGTKPRYDTFPAWLLVWHPDRPVIGESVRVGNGPDGGQWFLAAWGGFLAPVEDLPRAVHELGLILSKPIRVPGVRLVWLRRLRIALHRLKGWGGTG